MLDRLVGYEVSNVAFRRIGPGTSAGRVQSVADPARRRPRARPHGVPRRRLLGPRGHVRAATATADVGVATFPATLVTLDGKRLASGRDFDADHRRARRRRRRRAPRRGRRRPRSPVALADRPFRVASVETRGRRPSDRSAPFITSTLQQEAGRKLGFSAGPHDARRAGPLRAGPHHLHAHRLDHALRPGGQRGAAPDPPHVRRRATSPTQPRTYRSKVKNAQEAHEAIRPAGDRMRTADDLGARAPQRRRAAALRPHLEAHGRVPDGRRPRSGASRSGSRRPSSAGEEAVFQATGRTIEFPGYLPRLRRRRRRSRRRARGPRGDPPAARGRRRRRLPASCGRRATPRSRRRATPRRAW